MVALFSKKIQATNVRLLATENIFPVWQLPDGTFGMPAVTLDLLDAFFGENDIAYPKCTPEYLVHLQDFGIFSK
jgi:hypothetical protein